jgi:hypothetical protein
MSVCLNCGEPVGAPHQATCPLAVAPGDPPPCPDALARDSGTVETGWSEGWLAGYRAALVRGSGPPPGDPLAVLFEKLLALANNVRDAHRDPQQTNGPTTYNECDKPGEECLWCAELGEVERDIRAAIARGSAATDLFTVLREHIRWLRSDSIGEGASVIGAKARAYTLEQAIPEIGTALRRSSVRAPEGGERQDLPGPRSFQSLAEYRAAVLAYIADTRVTPPEGSAP